MMKNLLTLLLILTGPAFAISGFAQTTVGNIEHDGINRDYRIHLPPDFNISESLPLVFNLHGFTSNAFQQEIYSGMNAVSDSARFIICYPNGINAAWNVGWPGGSTADDLGFIEAMIDEFTSLYNINTNRVYSCGMSNGGFMSYNLACNLPDKIAAIASVTGSMVPGTIDNCQPNIARPIMEIHGTSDGTVPYNGSPVIAAPIEEVVAHWVSLNNCSSISDTTEIPNINTTDLSTATRIDYNQCDPQKMVSLIKVENGGHTWPGSVIPIGTTNQDFNASVTIWEFFNQFTLDQTTNVEDLSSVQGTISLFPNPASDVLQIKFPAGYENSVNINYEILGMNGKNSRGTLIEGQSSISIVDLPKGIYIFRIPGIENGQQRFIKL